MKKRKDKMKQTWIKIGIVCAITLLLISSVSIAQPDEKSIKNLKTQELTPDKVITPWGIADKNKVHEVKSGTKKDIREFDKVKYPPAYLPYGGWIEWFEYSQSNSISNVRSYSIVPMAPTSNGALIYYFIGIEPSNSASIFQPVLQYGNNGAFGGNYWTISSWYWNPNGDYDYSTPKTVYTGNQVYYYIGYNNPYWYIYASSAGQSTYLTYLTGMQFTRAYVALEGYNVKSCSQLPGTETFYSTTVNGYQRSWSGHMYYYDCGLSTEVKYTNGNQWLTLHTNGQ